ncbi:MAG: hypothetical protein K8S94_08620 [Planctomycetia bacterium]|nr:hypothetical protein [Planctomycetia bacterium]
MTNPEQISSRRSRDAAAGRPVHSPLVLGCVWTALVAVAVIGRLWQPSWNGEPLWNATPLAGVALAAGFVFPNMLLAATVPLAALAISNLALPPYGSLILAAVVYAATAWPVLLGSFGLLGRDKPRWAAVIGGSLASSLVFYVTTNVAHWLCTADYPRTAAGLVECLVAALPFYRWMPVGDVAWTIVVFGLLAVARTAVDAAALRGLRSQAISVRPLD